MMNVVLLFIGRNKQIEHWNVPIFAFFTMSNQKLRCLQASCCFEILSLFCVASQTSSMVLFCPFPSRPSPPSEALTTPRIPLLPFAERQVRITHQEENKQDSSRKRKKKAIRFKKEKKDMKVE